VPAELVTLVVGVVGAVTTLIVGTLAYFKDRRDTRTQLLRDAELVERLAGGTVWHDELGIHAQSILKIYVYERVHALAQREELGKRAAKSLFVLVAAGIGLITLTNSGDFHWMRTTVLWTLSAVAVVSAIRYFRYSVGLGRRGDAFRPPDPPGSPPRRPSRAQRLRARAANRRRLQPMP
jgi:hypothetical protein